MQFNILIDAPREKVWDTMLNDSTYRQWTEVFSPGSRAETDWKQGSKVLFVDGTNTGMVSEISKNKEHEYLLITHLGVVQDGIENLTNDEARKWSGSTESYTFKDSKGGTELTIDMEGAAIPEEFQKYFAEAWPKALDKLKSLAES